MKYQAYLGDLGFLARQAAVGWIILFVGIAVFATSALIASLETQDQAKILLVALMTAIPIVAVSHIYSWKQGYHLFKPQVKSKRNADEETIGNLVSIGSMQIPAISLTLRLKLFLGRFLGFFFVPENYVQAIYREGLYYDARGPGLARYDWWAETLGPLVWTSGQFGEYTLKDMFTRDIVPVTIKVQAIVAYNPIGTKREIARILTTLPRQTLKGVAEPYLRWAMMEAVNRYDATQLTQHDVLTQIADELAPKVSADMRFLGLITANVKILEVHLPQTLAERLEIIAQRRATIEANVGVDPTDMRRALVTEVLEAIGNMPRLGGSEEAFINLAELLRELSEVHHEEHG